MLTHKKQYSVLYSRLHVVRGSGFTRDPIIVFTPKGYYFHISLVFVVSIQGWTIDFYNSRPNNITKYIYICHTYIYILLYSKNDQIVMNKKNTKYEYLKRFFRTLHLKCI